jgi:hypothetical protein
MERGPVFGPLFVSFPGHRRGFAFPRIVTSGRHETVNRRRITIIAIHSTGNAAAGTIVLKGIGTPGHMQTSIDAWPPTATILSSASQAQPGLARRLRGRLPAPFIVGERQLALYP